VFHTHSDLAKGGIPIGLCFTLTALSNPSDMKEKNSRKARRRRSHEDIRKDREEMKRSRRSLREEEVTATHGLSRQRQRDPGQRFSVMRAR
jgi:hypothetical protein